MTDSQTLHLIHQEQISQRRDLSEFKKEVRADISELKSDVKGIEIKFKLIPFSITMVGILMSIAGTSFVLVKALI